MDKEGLFEMAEGGSLLLDEIGEMPPYLQTKLLRVLQEREYRPIGSDRIVHVDFRLICATNIDLDAALRDGRLREDLYFRINTITLRVPPLRERTEDIPLLCDYFLDKFRQRYQKNVKTLAPSVYHLLIRNRWPGNVRELENAIERAVLVAKGSEIAVADLPESIREESTSVDRLRHPAAPHAGRDREDGDPADAAADQLEQAGSGADPRAVPADALQQDEEARHPRRRQSRRATPPRRRRDARRHVVSAIPVSSSRRISARCVSKPDGLQRTSRATSAIAGRSPSRRGTQLVETLRRRAASARGGGVMDNSRAMAATIVGAVIGGVAGYLFFTDDGRSVRRQLEPALEDFARELISFRATVQKAAGVANEGWKLLNEAMGDSGQPAHAYPSARQTSPF